MVSIIFIEREIAGHDQVAVVCDSVGAPVRIVDSLKEAYDYVSSHADPVARGKQTLILSTNRGALIKAGP